MRAAIATVLLMVGGWLIISTALGLGLGAVVVLTGWLVMMERKLA